MPGPVFATKTYTDGAIAAAIASLSSGFKFPITPSVFTNDHLNRIIGIDPNTNLAIPYAVESNIDLGLPAVASFNINRWDEGSGDFISIEDTITGETFTMTAGNQVPTGPDLNTVAFYMRGYIEMEIKDSINNEQIWSADVTPTNPAEKATTTWSPSGSTPGIGIPINIKLNDDIITTFIAEDYGGSNPYGFFHTGIKPALEGLGYIVVDDDYPTILITAPITGPSFEGSSLSAYFQTDNTVATDTITFVDYPATSKNVGVRLDGILLFTMVGVSYVNISDFIDAVVIELTSRGYQNATNVNPNLTLSAPAFSGDTLNGKVFQLNTGATIYAISEGFAGGSFNAPVSGGSSGAFSGGHDEINPSILLTYLRNGVATGAISDINGPLNYFSSGEEDVFLNFVRNMPILGKLLLYDESFVYVSKDFQMEIEAAENIELTIGPNNKTVVAPDNDGRIVLKADADQGWSLGFLLADVTEGNLAKLIFNPS